MTLIETSIQLARYARQVFDGQPGQRFVPGFTTCRSMMRSCMLDRLEAYLSEEFAICKDSRIWSEQSAKSSE